MAWNNWPGKPPSWVAGVGVCPARICTPGAVTSGLLMPRVCNGPPRELNDAITSPCAGAAAPCEKVAVTAGCAIRKALSCAPSAALQVNRRNEMIVGASSLQGRVDQDHPDRAAHRDVVALGDARVHAAHAHHDPAGDGARREGVLAQRVGRGHEDGRRRREGVGDAGAVEGQRAPRRCRQPRPCPGIAGPSCSRPPSSSTVRGGRWCREPGPELPADAATKTPAS